MTRGDPEQKTLMKASEASTYFNIPLSTIYFWYRMGNIDGIKVNERCLRIFSKSLQEFLGSRIAERWREASSRCDAGAGTASRP